MRFGYKDSCFPRLVPGFMNQDEVTSHDSTHGHIHLGGKTFLMRTSF